MTVNEDISCFAGTYGDVNTGTDSFSYTADDGVVDSNLATVSITLTPMPFSVTDIQPNTMQAGATTNVTIALLVAGFIVTP